MLEALLTKYQDEGIVGGLDNVKMLEIPPFSAMGTPFQLLKPFGGTKAGFESAVHELRPPCTRKAPERHRAAVAHCG